MSETSIVKELSDNGVITLSECSVIPSGCKELKLDSFGKMQISALVNQLPVALAANQLANAYTLRFPEGLPHTLMALKQGGFSSVIQGADKKILGTASLFQLNAQAAVLGAFTVMSVITSQYFLASINKELKIINTKLESILKFLYGDKKAELISEIEFVKYATDNYSSIMQNEPQRIATLTNIQLSKKTARKDVEFYIEDLQNVVNQKEHERIPEVLENITLSIRLYELASLLEVHYAQNYDETFLEFVKKYISEYIIKSEKRMLTSLGVIKAYALNGKIKIAKHEKQDFGIFVLDIIGKLESNEYFDRAFLNDAISAPAKKANYYITADKRVYIDTTA